MSLEEKIEHHHEFDDLIKGEYTGEIKEKGDTIHFDLHQIGVKDDSDKPRLDLVLGDFANALWAVGLVGTYGAKKYTDKGWHEIPNAQERYANALLRHYIRYKTGEYIDLESGLGHLAHMAWNALAILQLECEKSFTVGTIEEVQSTHPDFKSIKKLQDGYNEFVCKYKYDCHYKE